MYSALAAVCLAALALVPAASAASFKFTASTPMLSCSANVDLGTVQSVSTASTSIDEPAAGVYMIYDTLKSEMHQIRTHELNMPLMVARPNGRWLQAQFWRLEPSGDPSSNEYTFTNVWLNGSAIVTPEGGIITTPGPGHAFTISPAGQGTFTIQVPREDKVWTIAHLPVDLLDESIIHLGPQTGEIETKWRFVRIE
ncbi:hypothetical protein C8R45DRAFT_987340 [Mycena sanguinolenta]|nr:hypothetical protein C8R45DRAFT_987340 [Mycena sanguinolenta]